MLIRGFVDIISGSDTGVCLSSKCIYYCVVSWVAFFSILWTLIWMRLDMYTLALHVLTIERGSFRRLYSVSGG